MFSNVYYCCSSVFDHQLPLPALAYLSVRQQAHIQDSMDVVEKSFLIACTWTVVKLAIETILLMWFLKMVLKLIVTSFGLGMGVLFTSPNIYVFFTVRWISSQERHIFKYLICTDSFSSLESFRNTLSCNYIIVDIQLSLGSYRRGVFQCVLLLFVGM